MQLRVSDRAWTASCEEKNKPSVCDNSSFTVSTNNLQAVLSAYPGPVFTFAIFMEKAKAPRTWSAKTNLQPGLNKSSPCNGADILLKRASTAQVTNSRTTVQVGTQSRKRHMSVSTQRKGRKEPEREQIFSIRTS